MGVGVWSNIGRRIVVDGNLTRASFVLILLEQRGDTISVEMTNFSRD